uniref:Avh329 n=1 Tax=Phytophthora sojae TaxID=67593 RepID=G1FSU3_PHYSO|nr:Avh329 [Phytophthora sojae]
MGTRHLQLSVVAIFILFTCLLATAAEISSPDAPIYRARLLRTAKAIDSDAAEPPVEDRGLFSKNPMKAQIKQWVNAGESVDNVKAALGMERLSGATLEAHSSYKYYQKFVEKTLKKWLKDDTSTYRAWINLGLLDGHSSDAFETYMRYAKMFNDEMWRTKGTLDQPPIYLEGSRAERLAKAQVWADAQRPNWYVCTPVKSELNPTIRTISSSWGWLVEDGGNAMRRLLTIYERDRPVCPSV